MSEIVKAHPEGIKGEVFALLHQNLCAIKTEYVGQSVLWPTSMFNEGRPIPRVCA